MKPEELQPDEPYDQQLAHAVLSDPPFKRPPENFKEKVMRKVKERRRRDRGKPKEKLQ